MKIRVGFSTQYAQRKFDVEVDDNDFEQTCRDNGLTPEQTAQVSVAEKYALLSTLANWYCALEAARVLPEQTEAKTAEAAGYQGYLGQLLAGIKGRLEPASDAS